MMGHDAQRRYYEKNRETLCARMRERAAMRRQKEREAAATSPDAAEAWRTENRERYYSTVESRITRQINVWLTDPTICDSFKQFLRQCVWEHRGKLTPKFVRVLGQLNIGNAFNTDAQLPHHFIDEFQRPDSASDTESARPTSPQTSEDNFPKNEIVRL
jgi:hypothetical protein